MTEILAIAVALTVLAGGAAVALKILKVLKRFGDALDDWAGEPARDGVPERPGVMRRLAGIEGRTAAIEAQLKPNGGSSLRDAVDLIADQTRTGE